MFVIVSITGQPLFNGTTLKLRNRIDVNRDSLNVKTVIGIVENIEKAVLTEVTFVLQQHVKVTGLIGVAVNTGADNLHVDNTHTGVGGFHDRVKMFAYIF